MNLLRPKRMINRRKTSRILFVAVALMTLALLCKMSYAEDFKWQWKMTVEHAPDGREFWYTFLEAPSGDAIAFAIQEKGYVEAGPLVMYDPTPVLSFHFIAKLPKGALVSPLRPLVELDKEVLEINAASKFEGVGPGYVWKFEDIEDPLIQKILEAKNLKITYLVFLSWEKTAFFKLGAIKDAVMTIREKVEKASPTPSKKPAHIKP